MSLTYIKDISYIRNNNFAIWAQSRVIDWLLKNGFIIEKEYWRPCGKIGEVDILARKKDFYIAIEVKARSKSFENVWSLKQQNRMRKLLSTLHDPVVMVCAVVNRFGDIRWFKIYE